MLQKVVTEEKLLPQPLTVLNVGGHFSIGLRQAKNAASDGYNFVVMHMAMMTGQASGVMDFGYNDFESVARIGSFCECSVVRSNLGIDSVDALLDKAASEPNALVHGANLGAINHVFGLMMQDLKPGAAFRFVQTGGDAKTYPALAGDHVDVGAFAAAGAVTFTRTEDGKPNPESPVKLLAYAGPERHASLPDIPTFKDLGYDFEFCVDMWYFAPKGTPQEAIDGFADLVRRALETEAMQAYFQKQAMVGRFLAGEELRKDMDAQWARVEPVAKRAMKK
jgi:tripartite-type tricarboxylate transporter receptor subunit TctC